MRKENVSPKGEVANSPIPWHVLIWNDFSNHTCGGVILDHMTILSDYRCFEVYHNEFDEERNRSLDGKLNDNFFRLHVTTGSVQRKIGQSLGIRMYFSPVPKYNEFAIIKLASHIDLGYNSLPACLPTSEEQVPFKKCYYCGWNDQEKLRWFIATINQNKCQRFKGFDPSKQLCASSDLLKDGDIGGALICMDGKVPVVAAIAKGNFVYPGNRRFGIFTKILPNHLSHIKRFMDVKDINYPGASCSTYKL